MNRNFQRALSLALKHEGGFVNHPHDPGGATNKGITIGTYRRYINRNGTVDELRRITDAQVATVYRRHYWDAVKGDDLPDGVDYATFDFAINSGPSRAAKYLQAVVGVSQDGAIGPATLAATRKMDARRVINTLCDNRLAFMKRITSGGRRLWDTFGKGWSRRVAEVRAVSLEMAGQAPATPKKPPQQPIRRDPPPQAIKPPPKPETPPTATQGGKTGLVLFIAAVVAAGAAFWIIN